MDRSVIEDYVAAGQKLRRAVAGLDKADLAYPLEYSDAATAGQVRGSPYTFTRLRGDDPRFFLTQGYAVLMDATMPKWCVEAAHHELRGVETGCKLKQRVRESFPPILANRARASELDGISCNSESRVATRITRVFWRKTPTFRLKLSGSSVNPKTPNFATENQLADRDSSQDSLPFNWQLMAAIGRKNRLFTLPSERDSWS